MDDTRDDGPSELRFPSSTWWSSYVAEKLDSISLDSKNECFRNKELHSQEKYESLSHKRASQILWSTGMLSEPIPNGFYSIVPDKRLKELYENIPTLEELHDSLRVSGSPVSCLERSRVTGPWKMLPNTSAVMLRGGVAFLPEEGEFLFGPMFARHLTARADVILVDAERDKKLSMLKQLIVPLVKDLNRNAAALIKEIAGLVSDFYKRPNTEVSIKKASQEDTSYLIEKQGIQMLGQIKHGSCRPRSILFKVLADTVGLESRLVVGLPTEGSSECVDSDTHMSVLVVLNSVELMVDLMRFPGQLIPQSAKAIYMTHISAVGKSDSAENDSCDSPMEPNSPLYGVPERVDPERLA